MERDVHQAIWRERKETEKTDKNYCLSTISETQRWLLYTECNSGHSYILLIDIHPEVLYELKLWNL